MNKKITDAKTETAAAMEAGAALNRNLEQLVIEGVPYVAMPLDMGLNNLGATLRAPTRLAQLVLLSAHESFVAYVRAFGDPARSVVFADAVGAFTAVLDYHLSTDTPSFNGHRATYHMLRTQAWLDWTGANGKKKTQEEFAAFIETHVKDIGSPDGALLLEMVRNLEINKDVTFKSSQRVADGSVQFMFNENVNGTGGSMKVPVSFVLALKPFEDSQSLIPVTAKLRYRLQGAGQLSLWFELEETDEVIKLAFQEELARLRAEVAPYTRMVIVGGIA